MNRTLIVGWLISSTLRGALAGQGADAPKLPKSVLQDVPGLAKPVTYTETKIPLGELIQKVANDTGAPLTAAKEVADEPVAVVVKDLPARELLEQLADLLDYRWSRRSGVRAWGSGDGVQPDAAVRESPNARTQERPAVRPPTPNPQSPAPVYEIYQDLAGKQREEALRKARLLEVEKRLQEEIKRAVEMSALPPERIQALLAEEQRESRKRWSLPPAQRQALWRAPEEREREQRFRIAQKLWSPIPQALAGLLGRLTPQQWSLLGERGTLTFATEPQPGELPLPADLSRSLRSQELRMPSLGTIIAPPGHENIEESIYRQQKERQQQWAAATGHRIVIRLDTSRLDTDGSLHLQVNAVPTGSAVAGRFMPSAGTQIAFDAAPADPLSYLWDAEDTPERRAELGKDPVLGKQQMFKSELKPRDDPFYRGIWPATSHWLWDLLPDLARTYEVQFIADAYWSSAPVIETLKTREPTALFVLLDRFAHPGYDWERQGKLIRLRSRTWFLDRPREIPLRVVRRWNDLFEKRAALPIEEYVDRIAALSDAQFSILSELGRKGVVPFPLTDLQLASGARRALRLYASLSSIQRQALQEGRPLPVAQMTPTQRESFLAGLRQPRGTPLHIAEPETPLDLEQALAGSFSLKASRWIRVAERRAGKVSYRRESLEGPAGAAAQAPAGAGLPPALTPSRSPQQARPAAPVLGAQPIPASGRHPGMPSTAPVSVTRHPVTGLAFTFDEGSERPPYDFIVVATPP